MYRIVLCCVFPSTEYQITKSPNCQIAKSPNRQTSRPANQQISKSASLRITKSTGRQIARSRTVRAFLGARVLSPFRPFVLFGADKRGQPHPTRTDGTNLDQYQRSKPMALEHTGRRDRHGHAANIQACTRTRTDTPTHADKRTCPHAHTPHADTPHATGGHARRRRPAQGPAGPDRYARRHAH
jgi:hypothetical protein